MSPHSPADTFAIVMNAFLFASTFFILRPVLTMPLVLYSISGWNLSQEAILFLFVAATTILSRYLDNSEFQAIKSFSAVIFLSGGSFRIIFYGITAPVFWLLCTFMGTIYLIHRFSLNRDKKISKKTQQRQNQLFRLTLIQAAILGATLIGPAVIIIFAMAEWFPVADIC
ncbi:unnamed protein product, partial [Mesorhabditis belari]|uniref:Uncharacterized protein n=1 Tax=Mesorhabditis belari TaxID=2138241 RepID=A0AAF3EHG6_9BILA